MAVVLDQQGGHEGDGVGVESVTAAKDRQRPYAWTCLNCGTDNVGFIEDGCTNCPLGHNLAQPGPLPAVDFNCKACSGKGKVERRCGTCGGSGSVGVGDVANPPQPCTTCGGAGTLGMDCARCDGTGLDPHPEVKQQQKKETPEMSQHDAQPIGVTTAASTKQLPASSLPALPTLDGPGDQAVYCRYLVVEFRGVSSEIVDALVDSDRKPQAWDHMTKNVVRRRVVEVAQSPATDKLFSSK